MSRLRVEVGAKGSTNIDRQKLGMKLGHIRVRCNRKAR